MSPAASVATSLTKPESETSATSSPTPSTTVEAAKETTM